MYPGCSTTPKEKRAVLLHYVKNHLQPHEAPYLCKLCNAGIADEKNVQEHLTSKRHIKKQYQNVGTHITVEATGKPRNVDTMMKPVEVEKKKKEAKLTIDELLNQLSMRLGDSEQKGLIEKLRNSRDLLSEAIQLSKISNDEPEPEKDAPMKEDEEVENANEMENEGDIATELEEDEMNNDSDDDDDDDVKEYEENKKESKRMTEEEEEIQAAVKQIQFTNDEQEVQDQMLSLEAEVGEEGRRQKRREC